jgi:hypothetical protein
MSQLAPVHTFRLAPLQDCRALPAACEGGFFTWSKQARRIYIYQSCGDRLFLSSYISRAGVHRSSPSQVQLFYCWRVQEIVH